MPPKEPTGPLVLLPPIPPSIRVFCSESTLRIQYASLESPMDRGAW